MLSRMRFTCVVDGQPEESARLLKEACDRRGIAYLEVAASTFDYDPRRRLAPGDLLFRPAASLAAMYVERFLFAEGVATVYASVWSVYSDVTAQRLVLERAGVAVPSTIYCATDDKGVLDGYVARLGGFPIVASLGGEGGRGTLRLDSSAALYSTMDFCSDHGLVPALSAFVPDAMHWRVVVVGGRAVACYRNPVKRGDFRSTPSTDAADYSAHVEPALASMACVAAVAIGVEFAGVDILRATGRADCVLEANSPCYFPKAQMVAGIDVAGAIVESLVRKAEQVATASGVIG